MPIFCELICTSGNGRSVMSSPERSLWIDNAASWPCATAQMMFFGPNAGSPRKNTFGLVDPNVLVSTFGMFHLSNSMPQSRSIQGNAFSWPTATSTSSQGMVWSGSPDGTRLRRPLAARSARARPRARAGVLVRFARRHQIAAAFGVVFRLHLLEGDAGELAAVMGKADRDHEIEDRDILVQRVFLFPRAGLHFLKTGTHHHLDVFAAEPARGAA